LGTALDRDGGGELAQNLGALYDYCLQRLIQANIRNDDAILEEVARLIEPIAQGWNEIKKPAAERPRASSTVTMET
jgi:flagellar protein FliS